MIALAVLIVALLLGAVWCERGWRAAEAFQRSIFLPRDPLTQHHTHARVTSDQRQITGDVR